MKKLLLLFLAVAGMVSTASATDYIVSGNAAITNNGHSWYWQDGDNLLTVNDNGVSTLVVENCELTENTNYGFKIKVNENAWNDGTTFPNDEYQVSVPYTGTYTLIYYIDIDKQDIRVLATPMIRWSLGGGNWSNTYEPSKNFTMVDPFTWTYEVSDDDFTSDFSFRIFSAVFSKQAYPDAQDKVVSFGDAAIPSAYFTGGSTDWSWKLVKPSYTFEKAIITAVYNPFGNVDYGIWNVKADAYVNVTSNASGYCTFVSPCPLTISDATAYYATDDTDGTATAHAITNPAASTPMLIKGDASTTYSFQVAASGTDYSGTNAFKAGNGSGLASQTTGYNYILNGDTWYAANGQTVAANKVYLQLSHQAPAGARVLKFTDDDATGISVIENAQAGDNYFDLQGRRVAQPTKGLYIVNGKKVIKK